MDGKPKEFTKYRRSTPESPKRFLIFGVESGATRSVAPNCWDELAVSTRRWAGDNLAGISFLWREHGRWQRRGIPPIEWECGGER